MMTGTQTLYARVGLGAVAALVSVLLARWPRLQLISQRSFDRVVFVSFVLSRVGLFTLTFLVLRIAPRGDVQAYYFDQARQVLAGLLPYRDFVSSYAPLHPYLDAGILSLWHSPLAIMAFSVLVEMAILPLWLQAGRAFLPEAELRVGSLLYLASPVSLQFVTIDGQDNVVIAVLLALSVFLLLRSRPVAAGASFGASVAVIKFLPLLFAPAFFVSVPRRWRMVAGAAAVCGAVYGVFLLIGSPILTPLAAESDLRSASDMPYLLEAILGISIPPRWSDFILLLVLLAIFALIAGVALHADIATRMRVLTYGMAALTLAFLMFSKKSWPPYLMLALFPVCLLVASGAGVWQRWRVAAFAVFSVVSVIEHSYWASLLAQFSSMEFHRALLAVEPGAVLLMALEVLLIAGYLWLLWDAVERLRNLAAEGKSRVRLGMTNKKASDNVG